MHPCMAGMPSLASPGCAGGRTVPLMFKTMLGIGMAMVLAACASNTANAPAVAEVPAAWEVGEPSAWRASDPNEVRPAYATSTTTTTAAPVK